MFGYAKDMEIWQYVLLSIGWLWLIILILVALIKRRK